MGIRKFSNLKVPEPNERSGTIDPDEALPYLAERLYSGNLIIMVGAGASASAGLTLWPEIGEVFKEILDQRDIEGVDVPELATLFVERLEKQLRQPGAARVKLILLLNNILKFSNNQKNQMYYGQIYPRLVRFPVHTFYTTNWDELLEKCLLEYSNHHNGTGYIRHLDNQTAKYETNISHGDTRDVVYLHGTLPGPHDQLIITSNDYKNFENKATHVFNHLLRHFSEDITMLCVGYSFSDLHVAEYIQKALLGGHPGSNVFALFGNISPQRARQLWRYRDIYSLALTPDPGQIEGAVCRFLDLLYEAGKRR